MQNVEYKAELRDFALAKMVCAMIGAGWVASLEQTDTYFRVPDGRLKKRECVGSPPEYVFYNRTNRTRPKLSTFTIYNESHARQRFGAAPLPVWVVVKKQRELHMSREGVRIHLDVVEGVGSFIEFEALICPERNLAQCHEALDGLRRAFHTVMGEGISVSYADLVAAEEEVET